MQVPKGHQKSWTDRVITRWRASHEGSIKPHLYCDPNCSTCNLLFPNGGPKEAYRRQCFEKYRKALESTGMKPSNSIAYESKIELQTQYIKTLENQLKDQQKLTDVLRNETSNLKKRLANSSQHSLELRCKTLTHFLEALWADAMFSDRFMIATYLKKSLEQSSMSHREFFSKVSISRGHFYDVLKNKRHVISDRIKRNYAPGRRTINVQFASAVAELRSFISDFCSLKLRKGEKKDDEPVLVHELQVPTKRDMWKLYRHWATYKSRHPSLDPLKGFNRQTENDLRNTHQELFPDGVRGFVSCSSFYYHFPKDVRVLEAQYFSCDLCSTGWDWIDQKVDLKLQHNRSHHKEKPEIDICLDSSQCWRDFYDQNDAKARIEAGLVTYHEHKKIVSDQRLAFVTSREGLKQRNAEYDAIITIDYSPYCKAYRQANTLADMMIGSKQALQVVIYTRSNNPNHEKYMYAHQVYFSYDSNDCYFTLVALMYLLEFESNVKDKRRILVTSDGCHKHFKSCHVVSIVTILLKLKYKLKSLHWNFFASYHGKSGCDANAAHVKFTLRKYSLLSPDKIETIEDFVQIINAHCPTTNAEPLHYIAEKDPTFKEVWKNISELSKYHHFRWDGEGDEKNGYLVKCAKTAICAANGEYEQFVVKFLYPEIVDKIMHANPKNWVAKTAEEADKVKEKLVLDKNDARKRRLLTSAQHKWKGRDVKVAYQNETGRRAKSGKLLHDWHVGKVINVTWKHFEDDPNYVPMAHNKTKIKEGPCLHVQFYQTSGGEDEQQKKRLKISKNNSQENSRKSEKSSRNAKKKY